MVNLHKFSFRREDQADEYSSLRRELEQTIKNCRVLSFKLKKTERKAEQLEQEKADQEKKLLEVRIANGCRISLNWMGPLLTLVCLHNNALLATKARIICLVSIVQICTILFRISAT